MVSSNSPAAVLTVLNSGQTLLKGQYTVERELGRGQFAISYLARRTNGERWVIKVLDPKVLADLDPTERDRRETLFWQEAIKLARCSGTPHIAKVEMPFKEGKLVCLPVEYMDCRSLAERPQAILAEQTALEYIQQIGDALTVVHKQGLVHRDIRPANIYLRIHKTQAQAVLTNFQLAVDNDSELSQTRKQELTDGYSPVELYASGKRIGPYTDVYSLAATLYDLLTGEVPYSAEVRLVNKHVLPSPQLKNPDISGKTTKAIFKGMELLPKNRPQSVESWLTLLKHKEALPQKESFVNWSKWQAIWTAAAVIVPLLLGGVAIWINWRTDSRLELPNPPAEKPSP